MKLKLSLLLVLIITFSWSQSSQTIKTFTANGTLVVPAGVTSISSQAWGGGGSGGGASGAGLLFGRGAAGGGGGAYASATLPVTPGETLYATVAGSTPGSTGSNGTAGLNSSVATAYDLLLSAAGGSGGGANNAGGTPLGGIGGTVAASTGTIKFAGLNGVNGNTWSLLSILLTSGAGGAGANFGGAGGPAVGSLILGTAPGNSGSAPGGGGSGAINSALGTSQAGGSGAAGKVIIAYTCPTYSITSLSATKICAAGNHESTVTINSSTSSLPVGTYVVTYNRSNPSATGLTANLTVTTAGTGDFQAVGLSSTNGFCEITITKLASVSCSSTLTSNNVAGIVILPATVGGTVSGGTTINSGSTSGLLTLSGSIGEPTNWQSSVSPFTVWMDIANTSTQYTSGPLTQTTQFRAVVESVYCDPEYSTATTVTVNTAPTIQLANSTSNVCSSSIAKTTTLERGWDSGSLTTYSIIWNSSPPNSFAAVTDVALVVATPLQIAVPAGTLPGTYTGTVTVKNTNGAVSNPGNIFTLTVIKTPTITTEGTITSVCKSGGIETTSLVYTQSTDAPTAYRIDWNDTANAAFLTDQELTPFNFSPGGGINNTIEVSPNVTPGTYSGILYVKNSNCEGSAPVSITISPATVGGTVSGGTTINSGSTSGLLTLSGHTGSVVKWQSSVSPFTTWSDIANTNTTYTSGALTETTQFRAVVQSCSEVNSAATTVTVDSAPQITDVFVLETCFVTRQFSIFMPLHYTETTGTGTTYSIVWNSSPANSFAAVTDAVLTPSPLSIIIPAGTVPGTYTGILTIKNSSGISSPGFDFTVKLNEIPQVVIPQPITSVCASTSLQYTSLQYFNGTGNATEYFIDWDNTANASLLNDQPVTPYKFAEEGILETIEISANALPGTYSGTIYLANEHCNGSYPVSITISPKTIGGTVSGGTTINYGSTSDLLTLSGHTGSVVKWQSSVSPFTTWIDIANTNTTYTSGALTETTQFRAVVKSGVCSEINSASTIVTVDSTPQITDVLLIESCSTRQFSTFVPLHYTETTGTGTTYSIVWNSSPANSFAAVTDAALTPSLSIIIPAETDPGTYTGTLTIKNSSGISSPGFDFTVKIHEVPQIYTTHEVPSVCASTSLQYFSLQYFGTTGNPTEYYIDWDDTANAALLNDQPVTAYKFAEEGILETNEISANALPGTYSGVIYYTNEHCTGGYSIRITISPATVGGAVSGGATINSGDTSGLLTLSGQTGSVVKWQSAISPFTEWTWTDIANTDTTYTSGSLTQTTQFRAVVQSGDCAVINSEPTTVTVNSVPTIELTNSAIQYCLDEYTYSHYANLPYDNTTGSPVTYSIVWDSSPTNNFTPVTDVALPATPIKIFVPVGTTSATYSGTLTVKNANGDMSSPLAFTLKIGKSPSITIYDVIRPVCASSDLQNAVLEYSIVSGNPTSYYIDWNQTANDALLDDQPSTPYEFEGIGGLIETIQISANAQPGTYSGTLYIVDAPCVGSHAVSIVIKASPTAPIIGEITPALPNGPLGTVALSGLPLGEWVILVTPMSGGRQSLQRGSGENTFITALGEDSYTFSVTNNDTDCGSAESEIAVVPYAPAQEKTTKTKVTSESSDNNVLVSVLNKEINIDTFNQNIDNVFVYDVSGNLIYRKNAVGDSKLSIDNLRASNQVLIVKVVLSNSHIETKKVMY
ncbi:T9SS sorting signal type C domain-containing protein [Flavobacterium sp. N1736]|uniref:T9SS sorting signal type C domain-containing protein n=1 Tax=Flavobacterium sp. N1736 TaxID=2986823 RepID=UPI0022255CCE|nr:T9SS sorting signal type C domain-containing protein [Flavobacterium sp. N1736]